MSTPDFENVPIFRHPDENSGKRMRKFQALIERKYGQKFENYWNFHQWTVDHLADFWAEMWDFTGVVASNKFEKVVDVNVPMSEPPDWFPGAKLNIAENLLKYRDDHVALICTGEGRACEKVTYAQMYGEAEVYAAAFRNLGLQKGDRVACYMSNRKEAIFAMQATTSIGALWSAALPLLGPLAVLSRLKQIKPKILLTIDKFLHDKEEINMLPKIVEIVEGLPSLEKVLIVTPSNTCQAEDISGIKNSCFLDDFLKASFSNGAIPKMEFEQVSFSHPAFISYTSGTTGSPKAMIHGFGNLLVSSRDFWLHADSSRDSIWFSMSPAGWVSWNMVAALTFTGLTILLYEGVPYFLSPTYTWDIVDEFGVTHLFLPANILDDFEKKGYVPGKKNHLFSLSNIIAGGSIVKPSGYDFIYQKVKKDVAFSSVYGSTEMIGMSLVPELTIPIRRGEIPSPCLGINIVCVDWQGKSVVGEVGELLITTPSPSMLLSLWNDDDKSLYRKTYFNQYPDKFATGDHGIINPISKGFIVCGRSDDTLKIRGTRFGSIEIYNIVDTVPEVQDSICVSQIGRQMDERAILFVRMKAGEQFTKQLVQRIKEAILKQLTESHVPELILEIPDIPYSVNGKKMEIIVKKIINNMPYNVGAIANPESLEYFMNMPQLQGF